MTTAAAVPAGAAATSPPEARGLPRDGVRMLVASVGQGIRHARAYHLPAALRPGDLVVVNTSDTLPAALTGVTADGERVEVHLSTPDPAAGTGPREALAATASRWVVELRTGTGAHGGEPSTADRAGTAVALAGGGHLRIGAAYPRDPLRRRLWTSELDTPWPLLGWLTENGRPVRYRYTGAPWPLSAYRTGHADTPGSAEMPSAGRPVTARTFRRLRARGIRTASVVLHCGLSSPENDEPPYAEWYSVPASTVDAVRETRASGGRVVAIGTTVVRALESAARGGPGEGWTELVVTPDDPPSIVDGLLTGWHPPEASHLRMLAAIADPALLHASYAAALEAGYLWHEFGDVHLILP
ncbi:MAG TPA: S-adenosylmethionine:tRNA ribosyltransferase-isomerase [Mycobacteriales bacterium]